MYPYLEFLRRKAKGTIVEIGVHEGVSTACFLLGLEGQKGHLYSIDIDPACGALYDGHPQWTFIHSDSQDAEHVKKIVEPPYDVLMIDGWHEHPVVDNDLKNYAPLVKKGGLILMHDIRMMDVCDAYHKFILSTRYEHFELTGYSEAPNSGAMAWGLGVVYVK